MDVALMFAFLLVFVRCSAMLLASPIFGAQTTPLQVRIFTTLAIAGALTVAVSPSLGPAPQDLYSLALAVAQEAVAGLLLGAFMSLALQVAQLAGSIMDFEVGLGASQTLNPVEGVSVTVLSQYKFMLGVVVFLSMNGHHLMIQAFVRSYGAMPALTMQSLPAIQDGLVHMLGAVFLLAVQIAAPVIGVSFLVDIGLGLVNRAVPQMQALNVGMPAKIGIGLTAVGLGLPALVGGVTIAVDQAMRSLSGIFRM